MIGQVIENIEPVYNFTLTDKIGCKYDGFKVKTFIGSYVFLVENGSFCCEISGVLTTNDNLDDFIGARIKSIKVTKTTESNDIVTNHYMVKAKNYSYSDYENWLDDGAVVFIDIETDKGVLQLAAYNAHNGYYGHEVMLLREQDNVIYRNNI